MSRRIKFWEDPKSVLSAANCLEMRGMVTMFTVDVNKMRV